MRTVASQLKQWQRLQTVPTQLQVPTTTFPDAAASPPDVNKDDYPSLRETGNPFTVFFLLLFSFLFGDAGYRRAPCRGQGL